MALRRMEAFVGCPLTPADCLVVEHAPSVIASVGAAGFRTLAIASTYDAEELGHASWCVPDLTRAGIASGAPELLPVIG